MTVIIPFGLNSAITHSPGIEVNSWPVRKKADRWKEAGHERFRAVFFRKFWESNSQMDALF